MKKIGIVGGVAWLSTVEYYSEICRRGERLHIGNKLQGVPSTPEIAIESLDHAKAVSYLGADGDEESWSRFDDYHHAALKRLEASGAGVALIASNTAHHRFEAIVRGVGIPVISIIDAAAKECARIGATEVLIVGTALTMSSQGFRDGFARHGVRAWGPHDEVMRSATVGLIADLQLGKFEGAADRLGAIVKAAPRQQILTQPLVCLACTELPLAFGGLKMLPTFNAGGVSYLNPMVVHIDAVFEFAAEKNAD